MRLDIDGFGYRFCQPSHIRLFQHAHMRPGNLVNVHAVSRNASPTPVAIRTNLGRTFLGSEKTDPPRIRLDLVRPERPESIFEHVHRTAFALWTFCLFRNSGNPPVGLARPPAPADRMPDILGVLTRRELGNGD